MKVTGFKDTIDWYNQNAIQYTDSTYNVVPLDLIEKFLKLLTPYPKILDAGCGPGRDSKVFHEKGCKVIGVDISEGLINIAKKRNPEIQFIKASFLNLPMIEGTFDGVWAHASLVHLEKIDQVQKALSEFYRVMKNGAALHVYVKAQIGADKTAVVKDKVSQHERFFRYFTEDEIKKLLQEAKLEILSLESRSDPHGREEVTWISIFAKKITFKKPLDKGIQFIYNYCIIN